MPDEIENPQEQELEQEETVEEEAAPEEQSEETTEQEETEAEPEKEEAPAENRTEKRFSTLTAKLKAKDEEIKDQKEYIAELEAQLSEGVADVKARAPKFMVGDKTIYDLDQDQFDDAMDSYLDGATDPESMKERLETVRQAKKARREFFKETAPLAPDQEELNEKINKNWHSEWKVVRDELLELIPNLEKHIPKIDEAINNDIKSKVVFERLKSGGTVTKFRHALKTIKNLGIDLDIEDEDYTAARPAPNTVGKGKKSAAVKTANKFSEAGIRRMSLEEYERQKPEIMKWMAAKKKSS